jgi:hypothetical protein
MVTVSSKSMEPGRKKAPAAVAEAMAMAAMKSLRKTSGEARMAGR